MAYLLDTNVIFELRKGSRANPAVQAWQKKADLAAQYLSVLVLGELRQGIEKLRHRDFAATLNLERWLNELTRNRAEEILPVTLEIADLWGQLCPHQRLPISDGLLAATALVHDLTLVTRNTRDFERSGARLLNPFVG